MLVNRPLISVILAAAAVTLITVSGCTSQSSTPAAPQSSPPAVRLPAATGEHQIILFDRYSQRLLAYDTATKTVVSKSDQDNYFQYEFPNPSELYTAGSSLTNGFTIVKVDGGSVDTVVRADSDQGLFPLAHAGTTSLFTSSRYDSSGAEKSRVIVRLEGSSLVTYPRTKGLIDSGAIVGSTLYYTTLDDDTEKYTLLSLPVADADATPTVKETGLAKGGVYSHAGRLYLADATGVTSGSDHFDCSDLCYFFDDENLFARVYVDKESDLRLDVLDATTHKIVGSESGLVDFRVGPKAITVYKNGDIATIDLP